MLGTLRQSKIITFREPFYCGLYSVNSRYERRSKTQIRLMFFHNKDKSTIHYCHRVEVIVFYISDENRY
jgi:hypothetical protein